VPIDDHQCWAWSINFRPDRPLSEEERRHMQEGKGIHCPYVPGTFRPLANKDNDYLIDRSAQKEKDHAKEKLLPIDRAIVMARRMLYEAATAMEDGAEPPALDANAQRVRAAGVLLDRNVKPQEWAKTHLTGGLDQPVYSI